MWNKQYHWTWTNKEFITSVLMILKYCLISRMNFDIQVFSGVSMVEITSYNIAALLTNLPLIQLEKRTTSKLIKANSFIGLLRTSTFYNHN